MNSSMQMLADRMTAERIPVGEALRIGMSIAEELRQLHDQGAVHGALTPALVELTAAGVTLYASPDPSITTPYTAPEVAAGKTADARSDIFSFGAIFYEMLTGHPAFADGSTSPAPSGSPAVDRLVNACVAQSPEARFQRAQKLILDLRLLAKGVRRGPSAPAAAPPAAPPDQFGALERRIAARLEEQERSVATVAQVANEVLQALREQQQAPRAAATPDPVPTPRAHSRGFTFTQLDGYSSGHVGHAVEALAERVARLDLVVSSAVERLQKLEQNLDAFDTDAAALRDSVTRDIRNFERALKTQHTAIESARTAMGQTDDLVERVVEALDSLQSMFVHTPEERSLAS